MKKLFWVLLFLFFIHRKAPELKQRLAGKSIPFEKFSVSRCKDYFEKEQYLWLPALVSIVFAFAKFWNVFTQCYTVLSGRQRDVCMIIIYHFKELILLWNGFRILYKRPDLVKNLLELVHESQRKQSSTRSDGMASIYCIR